MRPQLALRLIGGGLVLQGLLFYSFATPLTIQIFPGASDEAIHVGMIMRRGLAAMSFLAGLVIFLVRNDGYRTTKRVLFGCGIGFFAITLSLIKIIAEQAAVIPLPAIALYGFVAVYALYISVRKQKTA
jgi:peptidoglycan/LPS O-acetylase OafA/YrhL